MRGAKCSEHVFGDEANMPPLNTQPTHIGAMGGGFLCVSIQTKCQLINKITRIGIPTQSAPEGTGGGGCNVFGCTVALTSKRVSHTQAHTQREHLGQHGGEGW